jgi:prophage regulatory protein
MSASLKQPDRFLRLPAVMSLVGLKSTAIYDAVARGDFPKPAKLGRLSAWPESEVLAWIEARKAERNAA